MIVLIILIMLIFRQRAILQCAAVLPAIGDFASQDFYMFLHILWKLCGDLRRLSFSCAN